MKVPTKCADLLRLCAKASLMILLQGTLLACKTRQHITDTHSFSHIEQLAGLHIIEKDTLLFFSADGRHISREPDQLPPFVSPDTASGIARPLAVVRHREIQAEASSEATAIDTTTATEQKVVSHSSLPQLPNTGLIVVTICYIFCGLILVSIFIIILKKI